MLLVRSSRKVVLTEDWKAAREERRATLVMQRIDELKKEGLWSLHQLKRQEFPSQKKSHWDYMLEEMVCDPTILFFFFFFFFFWPK